LHGGNDLTAEVLLLVGMAAAIVFLAVLLVEGALREGYNPSYHTGSELELGERGWIQRTSFLQLGLGIWAFAAGVYQTTDSVAASLLLGVFGLGSIVAGVFAPDPLRGYPPGARSARASDPSLKHKIHHAAAPIMFVAIFGACIMLAGRLQAAWEVYTLLTAFVGLPLTVGTALAYQRDAARTGLVQRALLVVYLGWIVLLGFHLASGSP
jgi:hypothetical protein